MPDLDDFFMRGAVALARRGLGATWPNPSVGAVVVEPGPSPVVLSRGWTGEGGRPHAERAALDKIGERARGCTLYVTLEPCAHVGRTPPCADAIIAAGIARVVCGSNDPDHRVSGRGLAKLRKAGITVEENVLGAECARVTGGHLTRVRTNMPFVQLKLAVGSDGRVSVGKGQPVWVTGEDARNHGHLLRARADAILVGSGTVSADNPELTCRLPGMSSRSPVRVILNRNLDMPESARMFTASAAVPAWIVCTDDADAAARKKIENAGAEIIRVPGAGNASLLDPGAVLTALAEKGITRVLIEGGPRVAASFFNADLVHEIYLYRGPSPAGELSLSALQNGAVGEIENSTRFALTQTRMLGDDRLAVYARKHA